MGDKFQRAVFFFWVFFLVPAGLDIGLGDGSGTSSGTETLSFTSVAWSSTSIAWSYLRSTTCYPRDMASMMESSEENKGFQGNILVVQ